MKSQATRLTPAEQVRWDFWTARGYRFKPGEKPPLSTATPPSPATRKPILDAVLACVILIKLFALVCFWIYTAADMARVSGHG